MSYFDDFEDDYISRLNSMEESVSHTQRKKKKNKPIFTRGYQESRERLSNYPYYSRSCFNCEHYYQGSGDKEEVCQNDDVLEYDMIVEGNNVYCLKWQQCSKNSGAIFKKKRGRELLD